MRKADAVAALEAIEDQLDSEAKEDESARRQYGSRWPMTASYVANGELRDRLNGYRHGLLLTRAHIVPVNNINGAIIIRSCCMPFMYPQATTCQEASNRLGINTQCAVYDSCPRV